MKRYLEKRLLNNKIYQYLDEEDKEKYRLVLKSQWRKRRIRFFSLLMLIALFSANAYAWFIFIARGSVELDVSVVSWDVSFFNDSVEVTDIEVAVKDAYPGMDPYEKFLSIQNNGRIDAKVSYEIMGYNILGQNVLPDDLTPDEKKNFVRDFYPFNFDVTGSSNIIYQGEDAIFQFNMNWAFEDNSKYYKVTDIYDYDESFVYYKYVDGRYVIDNTVTSANYSSVYDDLYLNKDDADTYFGYNCKQYEQDSGEACVKIDIKLQAEQTNETASKLKVVFGDGTNVGDVVKLESEEFYVISNDGDEAVLLAKYNLSAGNVYDGSTSSEYTSATGLQSSLALGAIGTVSASNPAVGVVRFASTYTAWKNQTYPYDVDPANANGVSGYLTSYKNYLISKGLSIRDIRLLKLSEAQALGCSLSSPYCNNAPDWITTSSYWLETAATAQAIYRIGGSNGFGSTVFSNTQNFGIRPVIVVASNKID